MLSTHLDSTFFCTREALKTMIPKQSGTHHQSRLDRGHHRPRVRVALLRGQGRHRLVHQIGRARGRAAGDPRQCDRAGIHRDPDDGADRGELASRLIAMTPIGRFGEPREIAAAALFLASDDSDPSWSGKSSAPTAATSFRSSRIDSDAFHLCDFQLSERGSRGRGAQLLGASRGAGEALSRIAPVLHRQADGARGQRADRIRAAILAYDDAAAAASALRSDVLPALLADTQAHLKDGTSAAVEARPSCRSIRTSGSAMFRDGRRVRSRQSAGLEAAEKRYRGIHVSIARRLPGLRNYIIGKLSGAGGEDSRYRIATLAFDSLDAYRAAYASPAGRELLKDEAATIRNARVHRLDARVEV